MKLQDYLNERCRNVEKEYAKSPALPVIKEGLQFLSRSILANCSEINPDVTNKIDILEGMLFGFVENCFNFKMLEKAQKHIAEAIAKG